MVYNIKWYGIYYPSVKLEKKDCMATRKIKQAMGRSVDYNKTTLSGIIVLLKQRGILSNLADFLLRDDKKTI